MGCRWGILTSPWGNERVLNVGRRLGEYHVRSENISLNTTTKVLLVFTFWIREGRNIREEYDYRISPNLMSQ